MAQRPKEHHRSSKKPKTKTGSKNISDPESPCPLARRQPVHNTAHCNDTRTKEKKEKAAACTHNSPAAELHAPHYRQASANERMSNERMPRQAKNVQPSQNTFTVSHSSLCTIMSKLVKSICSIPHYFLDIFGPRSSPNTLPSEHTSENKGPKLLK
jgi:hypothetical protein